MIAQTDDAAIRLKDVWKGNESISWPFDARYGAWAAAVGLSVVGTPAAWQVTRAFKTGGAGGGALLALLVAVVCAGTALALRSRVQGRVWLTPFGLAPFLLTTLMPVATSAGPAGALLSLACAVAVGFGGSVLLVRAVGRHVSAVTPARYMVAMFRAEAVAPRPVAPTAHAVTAPIHVESDGATAHVVTGPTVVTVPDAPVAYAVFGPAHA